jgi:hypothetical protein
LFRLARGEFRHPTVVTRELTPLERFLRRWQAERLKKTHADFLADPEFGPAALFFLTDIYAAKDFSKRDAELEALHDFLGPILPKEALESMSNAVVLNAMTNHLDGEMLVALQKLRATDYFTPQQYEAAYRQGDYEARVKQIDLIVTLMRQVADLHHYPLIGTTLHASAGPARRLGWGELHDFLTRGYDAWRGVKNPDRFLQAILTRETAINNHLFGRGTT